MELDLQKALEVMNEALEVGSESLPSDRTLFSNTLSCILLSSYQLTGSPIDIDKAVEAGHAAITYDPSNSAFWNSYGNTLSTRFECSNSSNDINVAIHALQEAIHLEHVDRGACHTNLSDAPRARFERTGSNTDLETLIFAGRKAVKLSSFDNMFVLGMRLNNLGNTLQGDLNRGRISRGKKDSKISLKRLP